MLVLALLTFALPWIITPGTANPFLEGKEGVFLLSGWGLVVWTFSYRQAAQVQGTRNPWLPWFLAYAFLRAFLHFQWLYLWRTQQQTQVIYNSYTWIQTIALLMVFLLIRVLASHWLRPYVSAVKLTQWFCYAAALVALYACAQAIHIDQWFMPAQGGKGNLWKGVYAGFGNPSYCAVYLSCLLPLFLVFSPKRYLAALALVCLALYLTTVRYAWLLGGIGVASYAVSRRWVSLSRTQQIVAIVLLFVLACLGGHFAYAWAQGDERWPLWVQMVQRIQSTPLKARPGWLGYGLGSFAFMMKDTSYIWAHNEWLQVVFELGVLGFLLLLCAVAWATMSFWKCAIRSQLSAGWFGVWMALLASSLIHFPFHLAPTIWIGVCAWAMSERTEGGEADG